MRRFGLQDIWATWIALSTVAVVGCAPEAPPPEPLRPVRHEKVLLSGAARDRSFSGTARAGQEIDLSFRVPGSIERLPVKVGDRVPAGQLIAQLEKVDYEIAERQARANLDSALANSTNAQAALDRIRSLYENDNASQNELDQALALYRSADANVKAARESLAQARRQLDYTELRAPVDGAIAWTPAEVNENVAQGQTVVRLTAGARPEVEVAIPEVLISRIREGDALNVAFSALRGESFDAVVTEVGVAVTGTATTFPVIVRLARAGRYVRPGMAATVTFRFAGQDATDRIYLPALAVGEDDDGRFVFRLEPTEEPGVGLVRRTPVETGTELTPEGRIEILSGVEEGVDIVTAGVRRLVDGQRVRLLEDGDGS